MYTISSVIFYLLPLLGFILLLIGVRNNKTNVLLTALWISLIALLLLYRISGGEILGSYFDYKNTAIYTFNFLVLITTLFFLFFKLPLLQNKWLRYASSGVSIGVLIGGLLLLTNLWINARFIENRQAGTPILQMATFKPANYCSYRYVFFKVGIDGRISYMCPNYYGIIPSIGVLEVSPSFVLNHLAEQMKAHIGFHGTRR